MAERTRRDRGTEEKAISKRVVRRGGGESVVSLAEIPIAANKEQRAEETRAQEERLQKEGAKVA